MGIICSICHKKQSGIFEDFPLSKEHPEMRICSNCKLNLQMIEDDGNEAEVSQAQKYFDEKLAQGASLEAIKRVQDAIDKKKEEDLEAPKGMETENLCIDKKSSDSVKYYNEKSEPFLDLLYTDIGNEIKNWAKWIFIVELIAAVIGAIVMLISGEDELILGGILTLILGPIVAFVSTWILYGFGELIDKTSANERHTAEILSFLRENNKK